MLLSPTPTDYLLAAKQLEKFRDHPITLADAVTAWSFDRHFTTMRSAVWKS